MKGMSDEQMCYGYLCVAESLIESIEENLKPTALNTEINEIFLGAVKNGITVLSTSFRGILNAEENNQKAQSRCH
jgi:hypothetical protein